MLWNNQWITEKKNKERNGKKKSRDKLKYKRNGMKPMGCSKTVLRGSL